MWLKSFAYVAPQLGIVLLIAPIGVVLGGKLGSDESFYNLMIYGVFTDLSAAIKRDLQRYRRP